MQKEPVISVTVMIAVKVSVQEESKLVNLGVWIDVFGYE